VDQPGEEACGTTGARARSAALLGLPVAAVASAAALLLPATHAAALPVAAGAAVGIVLFPFAGLLVLVFGSQLGGLIRYAVPGSGSWLLEGVALLVIVGVVLNSFREPRAERWGPDLPALRLAALFALVLVVSFVFADNRELALTGLSKLLNLLLLFYLVVRMVNTRARLAAIILTIVASTALSASVGVAGHLAGKQLLAVEEAAAEGERGSLRQTGASSDQATAASRPLLAGAAVALVLALRASRRRWLYAVCGLLGVAGVALTLARSTSLLLVIAMGWLLLKLVRHRRFPLILASLLLVAAAVFSMLPAGLGQRLSELRDPGESWTVGRRLGYHLIGADLLIRHPLIGVGPDNYKQHYLDYRYRSMPGRRLEPRAMHNMYLSVAVESGLVGFGCFAGILAVALIGLHRVRKLSPDPDGRAMAEAVQFAYVLFLVTCVFGAVETNKFMWVLTGLAVAVGRVELPAGVWPAGRFRLLGGPTPASRG